MENILDSPAIQWSIDNQNRNRTVWNADHYGYVGRYPGWNIVETPNGVEFRNTIEQPAMFSYADVIRNDGVRSLFELLSENIIHDRNETDTTFCKDECDDDFGDIGELFDVHGR